MTLLDFDSLAAWSGLSRPSAVRRWLEERGIPYITRPDGRPITTTAFAPIKPSRPAPQSADIQLDKARARLTILPLDQLRGLPAVTDETDGIGVYFLWIGPELNYVGQSVQVAERVGQHRRYGRKMFTRATWIAVPMVALRWQESAYVRHYKPPQNWTSHG